MSHEATLVSGIRGVILGAGITPVLIGPTINPADNVVILSPYPIEDDSYTGDVLTGIQVHIRGDKTGGNQPVWNLQGRIWRLITTMEKDVFPAVTDPVTGTGTDVTVALAWRQMSAPLALDGQGRPEVRDSYYIRTDRLALH